MSVCSKFSQLCFCQILFELVYDGESYHKNKKSELFIETKFIIYGDIFRDSLERVPYREVPPLDDENSIFATLRGHVSNS